MRLPTVIPDDLGQRMSAAIFPFAPRRPYLWSAVRGQSKKPVSGHSSEDVSRRYTHLLEDESRAGIQRLDDFFRNS